jgi:hypothetical protein
MIYDNTWSTDFRRGLLHAAYILKKVVIYSFETFVATYETRHFHSSKEHNTRLLGPENNKLPTALIPNAFMSMAYRVYGVVISGREMSSKGFRERQRRSYTSPTEISS